MLKKITVLLCTAALSAGATAAGWLDRAHEINQEAIAKQDPKATQSFYKEGTAAQGEVVKVNLQLEKGKFYAMMADCSFACNQAGLSLYQNGKKLAGMDEEDNSSPMFGWKAKQSGTYQLRYIINECEEGRCNYSIQTFKGNKVYPVKF